MPCSKPRPPAGDAGLAEVGGAAPPPSASKPLPSCLVAYHFAAARPDQSDARVALAQLCVQLEELLGASHAPSGGSTYQ